MDKRSMRRLTSHDGHQSGCMQGLMNMFDYRHGHPSQKLLSDRKHGSSRRIGGATHEKHDTIDYDCEVCNDAETDGLNGTPYTADSMMSIRELIEEELFQLDQKKQTICHDEEEPRQNRSEKQEAHAKKRLWKRRKMSLNLDDSIKFTSEKPTHRKHKSLSSLDFNNVVAETCFQIHYPDVDCLNHNQGHEEPPSEIEEQFSPALEDELRDATKVLASHFIEEENFARGKILQPSTEFLDVHHLLRLKDMFLKLLQNPDSQLVEQLHNLQCSQDEDNENSAVQQDKQNKKYLSYFWRKFRGLDSNSSKKRECAQDISKIVVLKPGLHASQGTISRGQTQKFSSHFSLFELTRRLKRSLGKERPNGRRNIEKSMSGEILGVASPSRGYHFIERKPKASMGFKRKDKVGGQSKETGLTLEQRIFKFYSEARKHLAESVAEGDDLNVNFSRKQATKPLGRILCYGDYSSSPLFSPRVDSDLKLLTSPITSTSKEFEADNEVSSQRLPEQTKFDLPTLVNQRKEHELSGNAHELPDDVIISRFEDSGGIGQNVEDDEPSNLAVDRTMNVQGAEEMITSTDFPAERSLYVNTIHKSCNPSINKKDHSDGTHNESAAKTQPLDLKLDCESLNSPLASPSFYLKYEDLEGQDELTYKAEHPSPVSVLDTMYDEDDMSPPRARLSSASEQLIQPIKINFQVHTFPPAPCSIMWEEEKRSVFELVNVVMQAADLTWDELLEKHCLSYHLLEPSFFNELEFIADLLYYDPQLVFDLIIEVLDEICRHEFDGILSKVRPPTSSKFGGKDMITITWEGVAWHLQLEGLQHTLDQIIARDFAKSGRWVVDLRLDTENIGTRIEEALIEELLEDIMLNCFQWDPKGISVLQVER